MKDTYYTIATGDGDQITTGLPAHTARRTAQREADERGESVYLSRGGESDDDEEDEEIAPSPINVLLDTPAGPLVEYGGHDVETVEAEIPEGLVVEWSNAVDISVSGTHTLRFRAPLVPVGRKSGAT